MLPVLPVILVFVSRHLDEMRKLFGKPVALERVNLAEKLEQLQLSQFFESDCWPEAAAVRELKSKVKSRMGEGFSNPFVFAELHKYVISMPPCILMFTLCFVMLCQVLALGVP